MIIISDFFLWRGLSFILLFIGFIIIFPLVALIDILVNEFRGNNKLMWLLLVIFIPIMESILYFLIGRQHRYRRRRPYEERFEYRHKR